MDRGGAVAAGVGSPTPGRQPPLRQRFHPTRGALLAALAVTVPAACGEPERPGRGDRAASPSTLTVLYAGGDEWAFGPAWDDAAKFLLFLPLASRVSTSCGEPGPPGLAESWTHSPDRRSWTVRLRNDVRWHDGVPVTARDVAFSIQLWQHPAVTRSALRSVSAVEVLDEHTLRLTLRVPGRWPLEGWDVFYPKHLLEGLAPPGFLEWEFWTHPVGNGPFRYVRHLSKQMVELEANPHYPFGRPAIDRVVLIFTAGRGGAVAALRAGKVDLVPGMNPLDAARLAADPRFHVHYVLLPGAAWIVWNHRHPVLGDVRVRRALALALDRQALARGLALPHGLPVTDAPYSPCQFEGGDLAPPWPHDPREAARLLEDAGWQDLDADGVRERNGVSLRFTALVAEAYRRTALLVQEQLRAAGVELRTRIVDDGLATERFRAGQFEAIIPGTPRPEVEVAMPGFALGPVDPRLPKLMAAARGTPDAAEADSLYQQLAPLYREAVPATYLHARVVALVAHRRIQGLGEPGSVLRRAPWRWPFGGLERLRLEGTP